MINLNNLNNTSGLGSTTVPTWYSSDSLKLNGVLPSLVYDFPGNRYYTSTGGATNFPFTSVRSSNATMYDQNGDFVWTNHNLAPTPSGGASYSQELNPAGHTTPDGQNGDIRKLTVLVVDPVFGNISTTASQFLGTSGDYTISAWVKGEGNTIGKPGRFFMYRDGVTDVVSSPTFTITDEWVRQSATLRFTTSPSTNATFRIDLPDTGVVGEVVYLYGWQVERAGVNAPQPYLNNGGNARYLPRFDNDPQTGALRGLLVEGIASNLIAVSINAGKLNEGTNAGVATTATTVKGMNVLSAVANGISGQHYFGGGSATPAASTKYVLSAHVFSSSNDLIQLTPSANFSDPNTYINFKFSTGTITQAGATVLSSGVIPLGGGAFRIWLSFNSVAVPVGGSGGLLGCINTDTEGRLASLAHSSTIVGGGLQLEAGEIVTSLIPTFVITATRGNDTCVLTPIPWYNQTEGSIYIRAIPSEADTVNTRRLFNISDGTANNRIEISRSGSQRMQNVVSVGGTATFNPNSVSGVTRFVSFKTIGTYSTSTRRICVNGDVPGASAIVGPASGMTTATFGSTVGIPIVNTFCGWLQEVRYYPSASASDAQLQAITT
jgi:hypothetical protein